MRRANTLAATACDLIIDNGCVLTLDGERRIHAPGAVAVRGREIVAVGPEREVLSSHRAPRRIDARGAPVHPGFIDAHVHIVHGTCRGIFPSAAGSAERRVSFADWKADVRPEEEHVAAALGALELLRNGFTGFVEPGTVFDTDAVAAAVEMIGLRALLAGCYLWDRTETMRHLGGLESKALYARAPPDRERCLEGLAQELHRNRDPGARVRGYVALYGLGTASDELLRAAKGVADEHGVPFHQHEGYLPGASRADRERLGRPRIVHLAELGVLAQNSSLIHVNVLEESEADALARSGASVIWCPAGYFKLGIGAEVRSRHPALRRRGVNVALGIDGALDATVGDAAMAAHWLASSEGDPIAPEAILEMQTLGAAKAAGLERLTGSLEPGKRADIVIRTPDVAEAWPGVNPVFQLALLCRAGTVDTVLVDGELVLRRGISTRVDESTVFREAKVSVERRMARLGLAPACQWPLAQPGRFTNAREPRGP